jgi:hypothetical protein
MADHIMIDLETLDTAPSCVILSIGAVRFDPKGTGVAEKFSMKPNVDEQLALGRTVSEDTLAWWANQTKEAQDEALGDEGRVPLKEVMEALYRFCWNKKAVWSNGAAFDIVAVETCLRQLDMKIPWPFWSVRDTRTLYDITGVSLRDGGAVTSHKAVEDAERQAIVVQNGYKKLIDAGLII